MTIPAENSDHPENAQIRTKPKKVFFPNSLVFDHFSKKNGPKNFSPKKLKSENIWGQNILHFFDHLERFFG